jgi:hypothetical protein
MQGEVPAEGEGQGKKKSQVTQALWAFIREKSSGEHFVHSLKIRVHAQ